MDGGASHLWSGCSGAFTTCAFRWQIALVRARSALSRVVSRTRWLRGSLADGPVHGRRVGRPVSRSWLRYGALDALGESMGTACQELLVTESSLSCQTPHTKKNRGEGAQTAHFGVSCDRITSGAGRSHSRRSARALRWQLTVGPRLRDGVVAHDLDECGEERVAHRDGGGDEFRQGVLGTGTRYELAIADGQGSEQ